VTAIYTGDTDFLNTVTTTTQTVGKISTSTTLSSSPNPTTYQQLVTFTAKVTPGTTAQGAPYGTVTFTDGSTVLGTTTLVQGATTATATFSTSTLTGGSHSVMATYNGNALFATSTSSAVTQNVSRLATTLFAAAAVVKLTPSTITLKTGVNGVALPVGMLQAQLKTVTGNPVANATVVFTIGKTVACTTTTDANGIANCDANKQLVALVLAGKYVVTFTGDGNYLGSTANGPLVG
jgi:hypothetical protein